MIAHGGGAGSWETWGSANERVKEWVATSGENRGCQLWECGRSHFFAVAAYQRPLCHNHCATSSAISRLRSPPTRGAAAAAVRNSDSPLAQTVRSPWLCIWNREMSHYHQPSQPATPRCRIPRSPEAYESHGGYNSCGCEPSGAAVAAYCTAAPAPPLWPPPVLICPGTQKGRAGDDRSPADSGGESAVPQSSKFLGTAGLIHTL